MGGEQFNLFTSAIDLEQENPSSEGDIKTKHRHIKWSDPKKLSDHSAHQKLFGLQRLSDIEDLLISLKNGFDVARPIKATKHNDGTLTIIDGHRRKYAAIRLGFLTVPVLIDPFSNEAEERDEMIIANLIRNKTYKTVGICDAVRLLQEVIPYEGKRGRPGKKNKGPGALISNNSINSCTGYISGSRRIFYAKALGISEKMFRMSDCVLRYGTEQERKEFDLGPRKPTQIYNDVRHRILRKDSLLVDDLKATVRLSRTAINSTTALLISARHRPEINTTAVDLAIKSLATLAKQEVSGQVPRGSVAKEAIKTLYRILETSVEF